ncbi:MAG: hypothetical protein IPM78_01265 [Moraxellaceae bacterium]|nr:hypothetical protein [Moraxellaceae bacterium]
MLRLANANISALPGECIIYSIKATNEGVSPVTSVVINDTTPQFTILKRLQTPLQ